MDKVALEIIDKSYSQEEARETLERENCTKGFDFAVWIAFNSLPKKTYTLIRKGFRSAKDYDGYAVEWAYLKISEKVDNEKLREIASELGFYREYNGPGRYFRHAPSFYNNGFHVLIIQTSGYDI